MENRIKNLILYVLIFALQLLITDNLNLGPYISICLLPVIIISLPRNFDVKIILCLAFGLGLLLDILSDGLSGLNAAAAVMTAALTRPLYRVFVNSDRQDTLTPPSPNTSGWAKYLKFTTFALLSYLLTFILLESLSFRPLHFILFKLVISLAVNLLLTTFISASAIGKN